MNPRIGFSTSKAWYSAIIRWFTGARVSHTFFLITLWGREMVLEEGVFGWSLRTRENFEHGNVIVELVTPKRTLQIDVALRQSLDWLGSRYDYAGLLGMLPVMVARWFGKKLRNPLASSHAMFCSEAGARILQLADYPGAETLDPVDTTPEDLLRFLQKVA